MKCRFDIQDVDVTVPIFASNFAASTDRERLGKIFPIILKAAATVNLILFMPILFMQNLWNEKSSQETYQWNNVTITFIMDMYF